MVAILDVPVTVAMQQATPILCGKNPFYMIMNFFKMRNVDGVAGMTYFCSTSVCCPSQKDFQMRR
jgi:hypothetical protein